MRRWTSWLRFELKRSYSQLVEAEMSSFLWDTIIGVPTGAWGHGATISVLVSHFMGGALFQVDFLCLLPHIPSGRSNSRQGEFPAAQIFPTDWNPTEAFLSESKYFVPRVWASGFFFLHYYLGNAANCILWYPLSAGLVWCCLIIGEMSWYINWAGKSNCGKPNKPR